MTWPWISNFYECSLSPCIHMQGWTSFFTWEVSYEFHASGALYFLIKVCNNTILVH